MPWFGAADFSVLEAIASQDGTPQLSQYCAAGVSPCHFYDVGQEIRRSSST